MEPYKLSVKIAEHQFNGEGPEDAVRRDFDAWRELVSTHTAKVALQKPQLEGAVGGSPEDVAGPLAARAFDFDERKGLLTLRALPHTQDREADTLLLLLLGYKLMAKQEEVGVTTLKWALEQSGCTVDRVDRIASKPLNARLVLKGGKAKGSRFSLTNPGVGRAKDLLQEVFGS
jgi:hypothetical protein